MRLPSLPFVVLDTETTGFFPRKDRVLELALVRHEGGEKVAEYESLYQIDQDIPPHVRAITRIQPEDLEGKPTIKDEEEKVRKLLEGAVIVGHNIPFDIGMLQGEGLDLEGMPWFDTSMLASIVYPEIESWALGYLSTVLDLPHEPKHRALGDVHATTALLGKVWERLEELPMESVKTIKQLAEKGPEGYAGVFGDLEGGGSKAPDWLGADNARRGVARYAPTGSLNVLKTQQAGVLNLHHIPPSPTILSSVLRSSPEKKTWVAVKNLEAAVDSLDPKILEDVSVAYGPHFLLDESAKESLLTQDTLTADELTLAIKLVLYRPQKQSDFPIHAEERDVWKGKVACTKDSATFKNQIETEKKLLLLDHRQLLELVDAGEGPSADDHVIIDDATMLEDSATKAFRWSCSIDPLRAAAQGNEELTSFLDVYQIWLEKVRNEQEIRYFVEADLKSPDARGLRDRLTTVLKTELTDQARERLSDLQHMLDAANIEGRLVWVEQFRDGGQILQSVPEDIGNLLWEKLYDAVPTTVLVPKGDASFFPAIVPQKMDTESTNASTDGFDPPQLVYTDPQMTLDRLMSFLDGKAIGLVSSKRTIEALYCKHVEMLEEKGIALIAQGMSGGLGRMQAEFIAAESPAVWLLTPWMYEGVELPPETVDHLWIHTLPFDHPSHAVLSRRAERYGNPFEGYFIPRLLHRLFRLIRTYMKHRKEDGNILVMDDRLRTKGYGKGVREYLDQLTSTSQ